MTRTRDKIGKRVALVELLAALVPGSAKLPTATHVGDREHHAAVEQAQTSDSEARVDADLIGAIAIEHRRCRGAWCHEVVAVDERNRHARSIGCGGPLPTLRVQRGIKAAKHRLLFAHDKFVVIHEVVVDDRWRHETAIAEADARLVPLGVGAEPDGEEFVVKLQFVRNVFVAAAMLGNDRNRHSRESLATVFDRDEILEGIHALEAYGFIVRKNHAALAERIRRRNAHELKIDRILVVHDQEAVLRADDNVLDVILDSDFARPDNLKITRRVARVEQARLAREPRTGLDRQVFTTA